MDDKYLKGYAWLKDIPSKMLITFVQNYNLLYEILKKHYASFGLSEGKFNALFLLSQNPKGLLLSELGGQMIVSKANITGLIDRLEKDGLVERISHPTDRRSIIAKITAKGANLIQEIIPKHKELNEKIASCLSPEERTISIEIMHKLSLNLAKLLDQD